MTLLLDPWSLTWRGDFLSEEMADEYVERLTDMFEMSSLEHIRLFISDESIELLTEDEVYPLACQMPAPLWPNRSDVYKLVAALLEKLPKLSETGVLAVLVSDVVRNPPLDFVSSERHQSHIDELASLSLLASERTSAAPPKILSACAAGVCTHSYQLVVQDVECVFYPGVRLGMYCGEVCIGRSVAECVADWSPSDLLMKGFVESAIAFGCWKSLGAKEANPFRVSGWRLGHDFVRSIGECGIGANRARADALIRSCVNVILRRSQRTTHALRERAAGASGQIERPRDGAMAWRADIDDEYHLHYWVSAFGIEFANAVVHNNFKISE